MTNLIPEHVARLLLVEGPDDVEFFRRLASRVPKDGSELVDDSRWRIRKFGGKSKLSNFLYELLQSPNYDYLERIGIVRDVDFNTSDAERNTGAPIRALQSVNSAIDNAYRNSSIDSAAPVLPGIRSPSDSRPTFSLLTLPGSNASAEGSLETILLGALADDPMMCCVDKYFKCVKENHPDSQVARNREDKNRLNVLLSGKLVLRDLARSKDATRELPRYMYNMKWWDDNTFDDAAFDDAKTFLRQLLAD